MPKFLDETGLAKLLQKLDSRYLQNHQSLADYYTKTETDNAITAAVNKITDGDEVSY